MHPVIRMGETGKWERIKDSPIYDVSQFRIETLFVNTK